MEIIIGKSKVTGKVAAFGTHSDAVQVGSGTGKKTLTSELTSVDSRLDTLEALIGTNADNVINRFNEIVAFLAGIESSETLNGILAGISSNIATKVSKSGDTMSGRLTLTAADSGIYLQGRNKIVIHDDNSFLSVDSEGMKLQAGMDMKIEAATRIALSLSNSGEFMTMLQENGLVKAYLGGAMEFDPDGPDMSIILPSNKSIGFGDTAKRSDINGDAQGNLYLNSYKDIEAGGSINPTSDGLLLGSAGHRWGTLYADAADILTKVSTKVVEVKGSGAMIDLGEDVPIQFDTDSVISAGTNGMKIDAYQALSLLIGGSLFAKITSEHWANGTDPLIAQLSGGIKFGNTAPAHVMIVPKGKKITFGSLDDSTASIYADNDANLFLNPEGDIQCGNSLIPISSGQTVGTSQDPWDRVYANGVKIGGKDAATQEWCDGRFAMVEGIYSDITSVTF